MKKWSDHVPFQYSTVAPQDLSQLTISEEKASCHNCLRARQGRYLEDLKCCTFSPFIANYLVGAWLAGKAGVAAQQLAEQRLWESNATPLGIAAPAAYQARFRATHNSGFGRDAGLLCPQYDRNQRRCQVWAARPGECAAYFCESSHGTSGEHFWQQTSEALNGVDYVVASWLMLERGYSGREVEDSCRRVVLHDKDRDLLPQEGEKLWAHWSGRRGEYYLGCWSSWLSMVAVANQAPWRADLEPIWQKLRWAKDNLCARTVGVEEENS